MIIFFYYIILTMHKVCENISIDNLKIRLKDILGASFQNLTMGLLTILKKMKIKEREMRILILGLDNAGKSTILKRIMGEDISEISPTVGFNIETLEFEGFKLNLWDVGGQKSLRSYWRNYFEATDGLIWVVDTSDKRRMADCRNELHALLQEERLLGASLLVFANKIDLPNSCQWKEVEEQLNLKLMDGSHHWTVQPCSAVTGENLITGIQWMVGDISQRLFTLD